MPEGRLIECSAVTAEQAEVVAASQLVHGEVIVDRNKIREGYATTIAVWTKLPQEAESLARKACAPGATLTSKADSTELVFDVTAASESEARADMMQRLMTMLDKDRQGLQLAATKQSVTIDVAAMGAGDGELREILEVRRPRPGLFGVGRRPGSYTGRVGLRHEFALVAPSTWRFEVRVRVPDSALNATRAELQASLEKLDAVARSAFGGRRAELAVLMTVQSVFSLFEEMFVPRCNELLLAARASRPADDSLRRLSRMEFTTPKRFDAFDAPKAQALIDEALSLTRCVAQALRHPDHASASVPPSADAAENAWEEYMRGVELLGAEDRSPAELHFRNAIALCPEVGPFHLNLAANLEAGGRLVEAQREYDEAIRLMPEEGAPLFCLGNMIRDQGDLFQALDLYERALTKNLEEPLKSAARVAVQDIRTRLETAHQQSPERPAESTDDGAAEGEERVTNIGLGTNPVKNAIRERVYMLEHPCRCGGNWQRCGGGSRYPEFYFSDCQCEKCGRRKRFLFVL